MIDKWTVAGKPYQTMGTGKQWYVPNEYKPTPTNEIGSGGLSWRDIPYNITDPTSRKLRDVTKPYSDHPFWDKN